MSAPDPEARKRLIQRIWLLESEEPVDTIALDAAYQALEQFDEAERIEISAQRKSHAQKARAR